MNSELPDMDSMAVGNVLHSEPLLAGARAILVTDHDERGRVDVEMTGFAGVAVTPVKQSQLFDVMMHALNPSHADDDRVLAPCDGVAPGPMLPALSDQVILVAEDNAVNQRLVMLQLRKLGYRSVAGFCCD